MTTPATTAVPAPRRGLRLLIVGLLVGVLGSIGLTAWAQSEHGMGAPRGGGMMFMGSPEHVDHMVDHMLKGLNATDAQRAQIKKIAEAAATDLKAQHEAAKGLHEQGMAIFTAPTVDANAAEALRQKMLAQHDQASKRVLQAMLDIANVLTPEQRAKFGERMKQRHEMMMRHMRERQQLEK